MTPPQQEIAFAQNQIDVGITRPPFTKKLSQDLNVRTIIREPLLVALPEKHPYEGKRMKLEDLSEERFIFYYRNGAPCIFDAILGMCRERGFTPKVEYEADIMQTALTLVAAGQGGWGLSFFLPHLGVQGGWFLRFTPHRHRRRSGGAWAATSQAH